MRGRGRERERRYGEEWKGGVGKGWGWDVLVDLLPRCSELGLGLGREGGRCGEVIFEKGAYLGSRAKGR